MKIENVIDDLIVVKRSGQRVAFNSLKIAVAIKAAFDSLHSNYTEKDINKVFEDTIKYINNNYKDRKTINVEDIQDIIEKTLKSDKYENVYDTFANYRLKRSESRKAFSERQQHKFVIAIEKINNINNLHEKVTSSITKLGQTVTGEYNKAYVLDNKYVRAHDEGKIYIHNLPYFNLGILNDTHVIIDNYLEENGSFVSLTNFLNNVKNEVHGIIALDDFDEVLSKFILRQYKIVYKNNLINYLKIFGFIDLVNIKKINEIINKSESIQIDFSEYEMLLDNKVIKELLEETYYLSLNYINNYLSNNFNQLLVNLDSNGEEARYNLSIGHSKNNFINRILLNEISKLPILKNVSIIYKIDDDLTEEITDILTSLILNKKNILLISSHTEDYVSSGLSIKEAKGKSNIANVSINLARIGIKYKNLDEYFDKEINEVIDISKNALIFIFETIGDKYKDNYEYLFNNNLLDDEKLEENQQIRKVIKTGTLNFNLIGLKECAMAIDNNNYQQVMSTILSSIRKKIDKLKDDGKYNFTLSAINYDEASKDMIELDKTIFGMIPKITKKDKYENIIMLSNNIKDNLENTKNYNNILDGGLLREIILPKNTNANNIKELIKNIDELNVEIAKILIRSD